MLKTVKIGKCTSEIDTVHLVSPRASRIKRVGEKGYSQIFTPIKIGSSFCFEDLQYRYKKYSVASRFPFLPKQPAIVVLKSSAACRIQCSQAKSGKVGDAKNKTLAFAGGSGSNDARSMRSSSLRSWRFSRHQSPQEHHSRHQQLSKRIR